MAVCPALTSPCCSSKTTLTEIHILQDAAHSTPLILLFISWEALSPIIVIPVCLWGISSKTRCAVLCLVAQSCPTLCNSMDCSPPGSSVHGDFPGKDNWSGWLCPPPGDLPDSGIKPRSPALQVDSLPSEPPGTPPLAPEKPMEWVASPYPGDLPNPEIEPGSPALQVDSLPAELPGKPFKNPICIQIHECSSPLYRMAYYIQPSLYAGFTSAEKEGPPQHESRGFSTSPGPRTLPGM